MGSEITDFDLKNGSNGVEGEDHYSTECSPLSRIVIYIRRSKEIGRVVGFFRNCQCGKYSKQECENLLRKFETSGIPLPSVGLDIHRKGAGCYYAYDPRPRVEKIDGVQQTVYTYTMHCFCKALSRTRFVNR
eukprot:GAHX01003878.1.p1 GENE.GAHX01003878.1~~GAHX01003878.1.p1  ORF type:complete len:132 (-),score=6.03 GAHX01003878.1:212-607(-)